LLAIPREREWSTYAMLLLKLDTYSRPAIVLPPCAHVDVHISIVFWLLEYVRFDSVRGF
jgi:hypothetical protein